MKTVHNLVHNDSECLEKEYTKPSVVSLGKITELTAGGSGLGQETLNEQGEFVPPEARP